jgi:DNA-binding MarR family transcriptional regulator
METTKHDPRCLIAGARPHTYFLDNSFLGYYYSLVRNAAVATKKSGKITASRLTMHIGFWMRLVSNHVSYAFARKLESSGVTVAEWVVLREMYGGDDTSSPSVVAELTGLTRGAVSKLVSRLLEKGLVTRKESSGDRRYQDIELTPAAIAIVPKLAELADVNDEEFFGVLAKSDRRLLTNLLKKTAALHKVTKVPVD